MKRVALATARRSVAGQCQWQLLWQQPQCYHSLARVAPQGSSGSRHAPFSTSMSLSLFRRSWPLVQTTTNSNPHDKSRMWSSSSGGNSSKGESGTKPIHPSPDNNEDPVTTGTYSLDDLTKGIHVDTPTKAPGGIPMLDEGSDDEMPELPPKGSNVTVSEYFNRPHFLLTERMQETFNQMREWQKKLHGMLLDDFFRDLQNQGIKPGTEEAKEKLSIIGCHPTRADKAFAQWEKANPFEAELPRMVSVDYRIQNTTLSHTYDLECFSEAIDDLFTWYEPIAKDEQKYAGPYFCFIQSSGMGKTKLMFEYQKVSQEKAGIDSFLILTIDLDPPEEPGGKVFDYGVNLSEIAGGINTGIDKKDAANDAAELVFSELERILDDIRERRKDCDKIALLFDESQSLLKRRFGHDAFVFRCVRMWLLFKREKLNVVAVFAGTNSKLTDYLVESDRSLPRERPSRDFQPWDEKNFHPRGEKHRAPFVQTMTMGSCLPLLKDANVTNEYERAVYYGRPLFALMANDGNLESNIPTALCRMLLKKDWKINRNTWINILSTRVQMGQTTIEVASDLVSNSYANLMGYFEATNAVEIGYLPDPVCARLAMCMMDESFQSQGLPSVSLVIRGKGKKWWTQKLMKIYSTGIVNPERGNLGEVAVALYMLFCGDVLRKEINEFEARKKQSEKADQPYVHFSVPLHSWLQTMQSGGIPPQPPSTSARGGGASKISVGFIQVYRNPLRSYSDSWSRLNNQAFLKYIYESGTAFYVFPGCPLIDMVIPLRITSGKGADGRPTFAYIPMLVSTKCQWQLSKNDAVTNIEKMKKKAKAAGLDKALCLLLVFASNPDSLTYINDLTIKDFKKVSALLARKKGCIISKAIRVPCDDVFGLTAAFQTMTPASVVNSELFSAHSTIKAHGSDIDVENDLIGSASPTAKDKYIAISKAMCQANAEV